MISRSFSGYVLRFITPRRAAVALVILIALVWGSPYLAAHAQATQSYQAGGVSIAIPSLTGDMVELGSDSRSTLEVAVPDSNRLLAGFVLANEVPLLRSNSSLGITRYAMVEVSRKAEFTDFGADDFKQMVDSASQELGKIIDSSVKDEEEEFNRKMKALNPDSAQISMDKPLMLGALFSKPDAYGFGMIEAITQNGATTKMACGGVLLRVKNRALFLYVYSAYKNQETLNWIRKVSEAWANAILSENKQ
jgi:hypothetical protein